VLQFSPHGIAFLNDAIIMLRYLEIDGQLRRAISVVKVRGSQHSKNLREFEITSEGALRLGEPLNGYDGLLTGAPRIIGGYSATKNRRPRKT
jgi:circadian clock protein KaiC